MSNPETPERATIQRFRPFITKSELGTEVVSMGRHPDAGEWVRYTDYLTVAAERDRLREEHARLARRSSLARLRADAQGESR